MYHRFQIGQTVAASGVGVPAGPYRVTRLLPLSNGEPHYRAESVADGHERAFSEAAIRTILRPEPTRAPVKKKATRGR
jgi:hypothetical protein